MAEPSLYKADVEIGTEDMAPSARLDPGGGSFTRRRQLPPVLLTASIFSLDTFTSLSSIVATLYVLPLLMVGTSSSRRSTVRLWSGGCALLTLFSFVLYGQGTGDMEQASRLAISLAANATTTILLLRANSIYANLQISEGRYRSIFNDLSVGIWEHDFTAVQEKLAALRAGGVEDLPLYIEEHPSFVIDMRRLVRITDLNATAMNMMEVRSREEFFSHLSDFLPETDSTFAECLVAIDERRCYFHAETIVHTRGGAALDVVVMFSLAGTGPLSRVPGSVLDVSRAKRLEAQMARTRTELAQVQRASALGALAASIAHEVNQPLAAISGYTDAAIRWLRHEPPAPSEVASALAGLVEAVEYARQVVGRVRALVGTSRATTQRVDLNEIVLDATALFKRDEAEVCGRILLDPEETPVVCQGDPILLKQVLVNLITNAMQAMRSMPASERIVEISVRRSASTARIDVQDNGPGWQGGHERAFQTFYTTKADGMGLGLSICKATVESMNGDIDLGASASGGAKVTLTFPLLRLVKSEPSRLPTAAGSSRAVFREEQKSQASRT